MLSTIAPLLLDGTASGLSTQVAAQTTYMAAPIWDIATNLKSDGMTLAIALGIAGTGVVAIWKFLMDRDKTSALKVLAIGILIVGVISALPDLGGVSRDTVHSVVR